MSETLMEHFWVGFPLFFAMMWVSVCWLIGRMSGWSRLASHYPLNETLPIRTLHFRSFAMGYWGMFSPSYSNVIKIGVDDTYLYLSVFGLFRIGHAPLQIPFSELESREGRFMLIKTMSIKANKAQEVSITMSARLGEKIEQMWEEEKL